jgi:hypothetical protein
MVQVVNNIIQGYSMGPLRALAQDPVQNALDARRAGSHGSVRVEYRLLRRRLESGNTMHLLTVTDQNTTGLRGPVLSEQTLQERAATTGYLQLMPDENWAAWEAMGYTKTGEDALGSRGQGKACFLFHSRQPASVRGPDGNQLERMMIIYDTLLEDGTYRMGFRLARPADQIMFPPYEGDEARHIIESSYESDSARIPLQLQPLSEIGSRIIVPFLSEEAVAGFRTGELSRWLERCWWRAIQKGELQILVVDASNRAVDVSAPSWWSDEPWRAATLTENIYVKSDVPLDSRSRLKIKRIVLKHDDELQADEIEHLPSQYSGVQLFRHGQWIETLGAAEKYADYIPLQRRSGFRGFVEFDLPLERELRSEESPQHDAFRRRKVFVQQIDEQIKNAVRDFAEKRGWISSATTTEQQDSAAREVLDLVADTFLVPPGSPSSMIWKCNLELDYPHAGSARADWGETLRNISISCTHEPTAPRQQVTIILFLIKPDGQRIEITHRDRRTTSGSAGADFGDMTVVRRSSADHPIAWPDPGKYQLRAECIVDGTVVVSTGRNVFVRVDPPDRATRDFGVDISANNISAQRERINSGEIIDVGITITNRTSAVGNLTVNVSLGSLLMADETQVHISGRAPGDVPQSQLLQYRNIKIYTSPPEQPQAGIYVVLDSGIHHILADVKNPNGEIVAHAEKRIYVEVDPDSSSGGLPYETLPFRDDNICRPMWELEPPIGQSTSWVLRYSLEHTTWKTAAAGNQFHPTGITLFGTKFYWAQTHCAAMVEWALRLYRDQGDQGGFRLFRGRSSSDPLWLKYEQAINELIEGYAEPIRCIELQRNVVSVMLSLISGGRSI